MKPFFIKIFKIIVFNFLILYSILKYDIKFQYLLNSVEKYLNSLSDTSILQLEKKKLTRAFGTKTKKAFYSFSRWIER